MRLAPGRGNRQSAAIMHVWKLRFLKNRSWKRALRNFDPEKIPESRNRLSKKPNLRKMSSPKLNSKKRLLKNQLSKNLLLTRFAVELHPKKCRKQMALWTPFPFPALATKNGVMSPRNIEGLRQAALPVVSTSLLLKKPADNIDICVVLIKVLPVSSALLYSPLHCLPFRKFLYRSNVLRQ